MAQVVTCDWTATQPSPVAQTPAGHDAQARNFINHLRVISLRCRAAPAPAPVESCAMIGPISPEMRLVHAATLLGALPEILGRLPVIYRPGSADISFDEAWLIQLARSLSRQDSSSAAFLLNSRAPRHSHRAMTYLMRSISEQFALV
ncbi:hypothetical protein ACS3SW_17870 [Roseobacteraceae bacterium S113]